MCLWVFILLRYCIKPWLRGGIIGYVYQNLDSYEFPLLMCVTGLETHWETIFALLAPKGVKNWWTHFIIRG